MVEIKAELLKWCERGFKFTLKGNENIHSHMANNAKYAAMTIDGYSIHERVMVDPIAYEKAVIDRIKEMIVDVIRIEKHTYEDVGTVVEAHFDEQESILINADPRPWESEYVIEVNHDDN